MNIIELAIKNGAKFNVADKYGLTPLHFAVENGNWVWISIFYRYFFFKEHSDPLVI